MKSIPKRFEEKASFAELQEKFNEQQKSKPSIVSIRSGRSKNKQVAPVQITAEQILREAAERRIEDTFAKPVEKILDMQELEEYRKRKRRFFEVTCRRKLYSIGHWVNYAHWEERQNEFTRARSIFERALDIDFKNVQLWLRYTEFEMRHKFINHARNLWDRCVHILPRVDQFWYKYAHMEEMLGNVPGARAVYERWMQWKPEANAWKTYVKMELRYKEIDRARQILQRFIIVHGNWQNYVYFSKFEEAQQRISDARKILEVATEQQTKFCLPLLLEFVQFEIRQRELERVRVILRFALDHCQKDQVEDLYDRFLDFEKQHGTRETIDEVIQRKKRFHYEDLVQRDPLDYDNWFDYLAFEQSILIDPLISSSSSSSSSSSNDVIRMDQNDKQVEETRNFNNQKNRIVELYERAIANVPPLEEKRYWRRYIYLWIQYAIFMELHMKDPEKTREIYKSCLGLIPQKKFSFSKLWILFSQFELRQKQLQAMRKLLGMAIGLNAHKLKLYKAYISIEYSLGQIDRVRTLYEKLLSENPTACQCWRDYAMMEQKLGELERSRAIYDLAVKQPELDMPEIIWKAYIDFEISLKQYDKARSLYERLLERSKHPKVWSSYAFFEAAIEQIDRAREIFQRAYKHFKMGSMEEPTVSGSGTVAVVAGGGGDSDSEQKEYRLMVLEQWREFEQKYGNEDTVDMVNKKFPKKIKKRKQMEGSGGFMFEEYYDYVFPDDEKTVIDSKLKILEIAHQWKKRKMDSAMTTTTTTTTTAVKQDDQ